MHAAGNQENTCDIKIGKDNRIGQFPRVPVRFLLQKALRTAMGYTRFDEKMIAEQSEGDSPVVPSEEGDGYAIPMIYFAVVGVCWPETITPTLRDLKHDVVAFGEVVFEHFIEDVGHQKGILEDVRNEGRRLLVAMIAGPTKQLTEAVEEERDFTPAPVASSTSG